LHLKGSDIGAIASRGIRDSRIIAGPVVATLIRGQAAAVAFVDGDASPAQSRNRLSPTNCRRF
jgi:hypothetical protein